MTKIYKIICNNCKIEFSSNYKRRKYCSSTCAAKFNNKNRENWPDGWKLKISKGIKNFYAKHPERIKCGKRHSEKIGSYTKGKFKGKSINSILDVSKRTASKILKRLNIGCCICGWKEATCDIHHINGKKVENANLHWNLTCVCPNHHRMFHNKKLKKEDFIPLTQYFPNNWKDMYYG
jgi:hypothetical protein